jgi:uncharacterized membrane protein
MGLDSASEAAATPGAKRIPGLPNWTQVQQRYFGCYSASHFRKLLSGTTYAYDKKKADPEPRAATSATTDITVPDEPEPREEEGSQEGSPRKHHHQERRRAEAKKRGGAAWERTARATSIARR